jgi:hypothetical protein
MHALFWETRPARVDLERDVDYVLARVLEFGRLVDVRWVLRRYGLERVHTFLATSGHPELSPRPLAFLAWSSPRGARNVAKPSGLSAKQLVLLGRLTADVLSSPWSLRSLPPVGMSAPRPT